MNSNQIKRLIVYEIGALSTMYALKSVVDEHIDRLDSSAKDKNNPTVKECITVFTKSAFAGCGFGLIAVSGGWTAEALARGTAIIISKLK